MRMQDYQQGRSDGLSLALRIVKEQGVEALEKEVRFRKITNINTNLNLKELNTASQEIRAVINEGQIIVCLSALHDEFDFGHKRLNQLMDAWEEKNEAFKDDLFLYADYRENLSEVMNRILSTPSLDKEMMERAEKAGQPYRSPVKPEKKQKKMSRKARMKFREEARRKKNDGRI